MKVQMSWRFFCERNEYCSMENSVLNCKTKVISENTLCDRDNCICNENVSSLTENKPVTCQNNYLCSKSNNEMKCSNDYIKLNNKCEKMGGCDCVVMMNSDSREFKYARCDKDNFCYKGFWRAICAKKKITNNQKCYESSC